MHINPYKTSKHFQKLGSTQSTAICWNSRQRLTVTFIVVIVVGLSMMAICEWESSGTVFGNFTQLIDSANDNQTRSKCAVQANSGIWSVLLRRDMAITAVGNAFQLLDLKSNTKWQPIMTYVWSRLSNDLTNNFVQNLEFNVQLNRRNISIFSFGNALEDPEQGLKHWLTVFKNAFFILPSKWPRHYLQCWRNDLIWQNGDYCMGVHDHFVEYCQLRLFRLQWSTPIRQHPWQHSLQTRPNS